MVASAGDVLIFDCRLDHTAAPNHSDSPRLFCQVRYGAQWYADACRKNHAGGVAAVPPSPADREAGGSLSLPEAIPEAALAEIPRGLWERFGHRDAGAEP